MSATIRLPSSAAPANAWVFPKTHREHAQLAAPSDHSILVDAEVDGVGGLDVRCRRGRVVEIGKALAPGADERVFHARRGALLPGLHDHHIHLAALTAARRSVFCGPPRVVDREGLEAALSEAPGEGWIRGVGYHESVAGELDSDAVDELCGSRPVRIQHRSGRVWFVNSEGLRQLGIDSGESNGQLFRQDERLRRRLSPDPDFEEALLETSALLAGYGVTGITDATATNNRDTAHWYAGLDWLQHVRLMGDETLAEGSLKILLDDFALPEYDSFRQRIAAAHRRRRPVAVHCVSRTELVFALSALGEAGTLPGDRIEHAAVADDAALELLRAVAGDANHLTVVTQPNFIAERGDQYLRDVAPGDHPHLYRGRAFLRADIPLGGGTDAPFGDPDPWFAMQAAVHRRTAAGRTIGDEERLSPEQALALFTTPLEDPGGKPRRVQVGAKADFCLLDVPWREARTRLSADGVRATFVGGRETFRDD